MLTTRAALRNLLLAKQGLLGDRLLIGTGGAVTWVQRQGFLPLEAKTRSLASGHDIALFNRVVRYQASDLDMALYDQHQLFEHQLHILGALPARDYPLIYDPEMAAEITGPDSVGAHVIAFLEAQGPLTLRELQTELRKLGWSERRVVGREIHALNACGTILVRRREGNQELYDLATRVLPQTSCAPLPVEERLRILARRALYFLAPVTRPTWSRVLDGIGSRARLGVAAMKREKMHLIAEMLSKGEATRIEVTDPADWYILPTDWLPSLGLRSNHSTLRVCFLPPIDPVIWDRQRAFDLFGYDSRRHVYVATAEQHRPSSHSLAILYGQELVGRLEPQMSWSNECLLIRSIQIDNPALLDDGQFRIAFLAALQEFAALHEARDIQADGPLPTWLLP